MEQIFTLIVPRVQNLLQRSFQSHPALQSFIVMELEMSINFLHNELKFLCTKLHIGCLIFMMPDTSLLIPL